MHLAGMQQHPFTLAAYHADQAVVSWDRKYKSTLGPAVEIGALQPKPMHDLLLREVLRSIPPLHVFNGHCTHSDALADLLQQEEIQTIALVRDPRDVVVSLAEYLIKHEHPQYRGCRVPCDYIPKRSYPLFRTHQILNDWLTQNLEEA